MRAGDVVKHRPSGETWVLAVDSENGRVSWCGWPEGMANERDCEIVQAATDQERDEMLRKGAEKTANDGGGPDHRISAATRQLAATRAA